MIPKPKHLQPEYGQQFQDESVAAVYRKRPPYPAEVFDTLEGLMAAGPKRVLDLGSGTGEFAIPLHKEATQWILL
jgi:methylase of polypeptide subunit release factors